MIVAEAPNNPRSVVIAPPRRWDPSEGEAAALLSLTSTRVPWLRPVPLASLASADGQARRDRGHASALLQQGGPRTEEPPTT